ncbi:MAG: hypothetical protein RLZZ28_799 [Bacteroidota bacterium]
MSATLIMPYGNYNDVQSIFAVYNHCLKTDPDMGFAEFIGEKILTGGFDPTGENEERENNEKHTPIHPNAIVQIQSGVLFRQVEEEIKLAQPETVQTIIPLANTAMLTQEFSKGIFHPPAPIA